MHMHVLPDNMWLGNDTGNKWIPQYNNTRTVIICLHHFLLSFLFMFTYKLHQTPHSLLMMSWLLWLKYVCVFVMLRPDALSWWRSTKEYSSQCTENQGNRPDWWLDDILVKKNPNKDLGAQQKMQSSDLNRPTETNDGDSDDDFHDARFPADEEAVRTRSQILSCLSKLNVSGNTEISRRVKYLQRWSE